MTRLRDLHAVWMEDPEYRRAYDALDEEFALATALIRARADAGLTQEQLAKRMSTKREVVARWEGPAVTCGAWQYEQVIDTTSGGTPDLSYSEP